MSYLFFNLVLLFFNLVLIPMAAVNFWRTNTNANGELVFFNLLTVCLSQFFTKQYVQKNLELNQTGIQFGQLTRSIPEQWKLNIFSFTEKINVYMNKWKDQLQQIDNTWILLLAYQCHPRGKRNISRPIRGERETWGRNRRAVLEPWNTADNDDIYLQLMDYDFHMQQLLLVRAILYQNNRY